MTRKYEFTGVTKGNLRQIRRLADGQVGGWIEKEDNLSHEGDCWVGGYAWVYGEAKVYGNAIVSGYAIVSGNVTGPGVAKDLGPKVALACKICNLKNEFAGPNQPDGSKNSYGKQH